MVAAYYMQIMFWHLKRTIILYVKSIENSGVNIQYLNNPTHELCNIAIQNNGYNLKYVIPFIKEEDLNGFIELQ